MSWWRAWWKEWNTGRLPSVSSPVFCRIRFRGPDQSQLCLTVRLPQDFPAAQPHVFLEVKCWDDWCHHCPPAPGGSPLGPPAIWQNYSGSGATQLLTTLGPRLVADNSLMIHGAVCLYYPPSPSEFLRQSWLSAVWFRVIFDIDKFPGILL